MGERKYSSALRRRARQCQAHMAYMAHIATIGANRNIILVLCGNQCMHMAKRRQILHCMSPTWDAIHQ